VEHDAAGLLQAAGRHWGSLGYQLQQDRTRCLLPPHFLVLYCTDLSLWAWLIGSREGEASEVETRGQELFQKRFILAGC